jgi:methylated-DNA-protein-cysteine methyltransferase-like protein
MKDSDFFELVYKIVREIPHGRVTSYGAIAKALGTPKSSRMVGYAMNAAHVHPDIPAHRVVNRIGLLTGKHHFSTPDRMEQLLKAEGIEVNDNQIVHFEAHFWDPLTELSPH